jgi:MFS family permease
MVAGGAVTSQSAVGRAAAGKEHGIVGMLKNPYVFMTCAFASIGCCMYGYDQGVMSSILVMENFQAQFPNLMGPTVQGWLVAALELGAWAGALFCGWLADAVSRKYAMMVAVVIFTAGTCLQFAATKSDHLFAGRVIGGFGIGMFSMVIPLYQAEIAPPELRGGLVSLQQLSITIGTAIAFWLDYGMHFVGGSKCKPYGVPESDWYLPDGSFNYNVAHGHLCSGEKDISWRFPLALQLIFAWTLFVGMFFLPFSPRWLAMKHRDEDCLSALSKLRRLTPEDPVLKAEFLEIKAAVMFDDEVESELSGNGHLGTWKPMFQMNMVKRVAIGVWIMIFQQFVSLYIHGPLCRTTWTLKLIIVLPHRPASTLFFITHLRSSRPSDSPIPRPPSWLPESLEFYRSSSHSPLFYSWTSSAEKPFSLRVPSG